MNDVIITKSNGNLGRRQPSDDMKSGMIMQGVAVTGGAQLSTSVASNIYELNSVADAEDIGLDAAYDTTNVILVHHHISEYFRMNPSGTIFLMLVADTVTLTQMLDNTLNYAKKLLTLSEGKIKMLSASLNPASGYTPTLTTGLDADVITAIAKAQALAAAEYTAHRPVNIIIEGRNFNGTATAAVNLRAQAARDVSVVIAADPVISASNARHNTYAAIGTILGTFSLAKVHENIGWPEKFNLQDKATPAFLSAGVSSNKLTRTYSDADIDILNTKGYIFCQSIPDLVGVYFNDSHTCTLITDDYAYMENNRTINKATRLARALIVPKLNSPLKVDPTAGTLSPDTSKAFEALGNKSLDGMLQDGEISGRTVYVDPEQDVLATSNLEMEMEVTPMGVGRTINVKLGFKNPF
jgi:hypothetical protein